MTESRILVVGGSPSFRTQVARALGREADELAWVPDLTGVEAEITDHPLDLVVLSAAVRDHEAGAFAQAVLAASPATAVVLCREQPPDGALPQLIRSGLRDVVDLSKGGEELQEALRRALGWSSKLRGSIGGEGEGRGRVICVFSSKGGSGKTFLTSNLAAVLAAHRHDTAAVDLNLEMGDLVHVFGKEPDRSLQELVALEGWADPETARAMSTQLMPHLWGFGSASAPGGVAPSGAAIARSLRALRSAFPYTVVDGTPQFSDHVLGALDVSDLILLIAQLDVIGVRHLAADLQTLLALGVDQDRVRVVLNRANTRLGLTPDDVERIVGVTLDLLLPSAAAIPQALNRARIVSIHEPRSPAAKAIRRFAEELMSMQTPAAPTIRAVGGRR